MQQVYFKRMTKQDITRSVVICTESVESFWGISKDSTLEYTPIKICYESNPDYYPENITIHKGYRGEKDWRICGEEFKKLYSDESPEVGDLMCVKKIGADKFCLSIIKKDTELYTCIEKFLNGKDNYLIISKSELEPILVDFNPSTYEGDLAPIILYGPPGTGKTFTLQKKYISKFNEKNRDVTTFHQAFSYEEFIEGLKPVLDDSSKEVKYDIEKGIFYRACEKAAILADYASLAECLEDTKLNRIVKFNKAIEEKKTVLLCIDEINRGNVAAIFGDLISLIESTKRLGAEEEMTAILPYSKKEFGVPANLLIVGTMNTADRSIQLLDSALRRRFKFVELLPNYTKDIYKNEHAITILKNINARVRCLLNKDNQIGHSYFMKAENYCDILSALLNKVIPLLEEYFYNDIDKVRFVLDDKDSNLFYVEDTEAKKAYEVYRDDSDEDRSFYQINPDIVSVIENKYEEECEKFLANLLK
jgi:5-methylcytosine-specific restriction endonuclease McrBC GTP-binding regulatory subunit McrB